jgi:hypothetical protein
MEFILLKTVVSVGNLSYWTSQKIQRVQLMLITDSDYVCVSRGEKHVILVIATVVA